MNCYCQEEAGVFGDQRSGCVLLTIDQLIGLGNSQVGWSVSHDISSYLEPQQPWADANKYIRYPLEFQNCHSAI